MKTRLLACLFASALFAGASGCESVTPETSIAQDEDAARIEAGRDLYQTYCSSCHGSELHGDGPVAASLHTPPLDLTRIAERRGGNFQAAEIAAFIDGRNRVPAHGEREMPVWGRRYDDRNEMMADETRLSPGNIFTLVAYLKSEQVKP